MEVTCDETVSDIQRGRILEVLVDAVAEAVDCPEEPRVGPPGVGDLEIRLRDKGDWDVGELNVVVEVRTKRVESRVANAQARADLLRDRLSGLGLGAVGVWLILAEGAWSQTH